MAFVVGVGAGCVGVGVDGGCVGGWLLWASLAVLLQQSPGPAALPAVVAILLQVPIVVVVAPVAAAVPLAVVPPAAVPPTVATLLEGVPLVVKES